MMFRQTTEQTVEPMLLTARQAARLLAISERTLYSLTKLGNVAVVRIGRSVRYDPNDLRAWIVAAKATSERL